MKKRYFLLTFAVLGLLGCATSPVPQNIHASYLESGSGSFRGRAESVRPSLSPAVAPAPLEVRKMPSLDPLGYSARPDAPVKHHQAPSAISSDAFALRSSDFKNSSPDLKEQPLKMKMDADTDIKMESEANTSLPHLSTSISPIKAASPKALRSPNPERDAIIASVLKKKSAAASFASHQSPEKPEKTQAFLGISKTQTPFLSPSPESFPVSVPSGLNAKEEKNIIVTSVTNLSSNPSASATSHRAFHPDAFSSKEETIVREENRADYSYIDDIENEQGVLREGLTSQEQKNVNMPFVPEYEIVEHYLPPSTLGMFTSCESVALIPDTPAFRSSLNKKWSSENNKYVRTAQCSSSGDFTFRNLPTAQWIMVAFFRSGKDFWVKSKEVRSRSEKNDEIFISSP